MEISPEDFRKTLEMFRTPDAFASFVSKGKQLRPAHLRLLGEKLANACFGRGKKKILVTMPPRHGKSQTTSWWFPTWFLWNWPDRKVILSSYEAEFASSWGRMVRNTLSEMNYMTDFSLADDSAAAYRWETSKGGGMMTAGVGGAITGRGGHLCICDDPIKNSEEAQSEVYRKKTHEWWKTTFITRLEPGGVLVLILTRWHEDDLGGRIMAEPDFEKEWEHINFPATCEEVEENGKDAIGRTRGEALWPERYNAEDLKKIKASVGSYNFSALYQQRPVPAEGGIFKSAWFSRRYAWNTDGTIQLQNKTVNLSDLHIFCTVDLAASVKTTADYTVITTWGVLDNGKHITVFCLDMVRDRFEGPEIEKQVAGVVRKWSPDFVGVEKVGFQLALIQSMRANGLPIRELIPDKDKVSRALGVTPFCEAGMIVLPDAEDWVTEFEHELYTFPNGKHDDTVDTLSYITQFVAFGEIGIPGDIDPKPAEAKRKELEKSVAQSDGLTLYSDPWGFLGGESR